MLANWPTGRRVVVSAALSLCVAIVIVTLFRGIADNFLVRGVQTIAIAVGAIVVIGLVVSAITGRLADYTDPEDEDEFEELVRRSERLAQENLAAEPDESDFLELDPRNPADFEELVQVAYPSAVRHVAHEHVVMPGDRGEGGGFHVWVCG